MKSINTNGLSKSQSNDTNSIVSSNTPTMSNQEINAQVPSVDGLSIGSTNSATSMGIPSPSSPLVGNMQTLADAGIPMISTPKTGTSSNSSNSSNSIPNVSAPDYSNNLINYIDDVLQEYTLPKVDAPSTGVGKKDVQPTDDSQQMKVFHNFDNNADLDISLRSEGGIQSVVTESKTAKDGLFSTDFAAKHYTVTFNRDFRHISVEPGDVTGGGRDDSGITVARIEKMGPRVFKVWFNRAKGANTYVNEFTVTGVN